MSTESSRASILQDSSPLVRKYLFDRPFDKDEETFVQPQVITYSQAELEAEVEAVRKASYEAGFNAGQKEIMDKQQQHLDMLLSHLDQQLGLLVSRTQQHWKRQMEKMQEISLAIVRKILPVYAERNGLQEIEAVISRVLTEMAHEPRLVIRVSESQFETIREKINALAEQKAYSGKVVVLSESGLGPADCKVEWADGGIERDMNAIIEEIEKIVGVGTRISNPTNTLNLESKSSDSETKNV